MSAAPAPLSDRDHQPIPADIFKRVTASLLTATLYALFALLAWWPDPPAPLPPATITAILMRDTPPKKSAPLLPPVLAHMIKPRAESVSPPVFTFAASAPSAAAPLPATAKTSPMAGGTAGNGAMGQSGSGNGNGSGNALAGCLDPVWMRAVTDRVRQFFYFPGDALATHAAGVVTMRFAVRRNGQIDRLEMSKSSGDDRLDKAAYDIMRKAQPLPPITERMRVDRVEGELPINFGVRRFSGQPNLGNCGG